MIKYFIIYSAAGASVAGASATSVLATSSSSKIAARAVLTATTTEFENAEKLNPPMEKRKQQILTIDLKNKSEAIKKEIALRKIPEIQANIEFKEDDDN